MHNRFKLKQGRPKLQVKLNKGLSDFTSLHIRYALGEHSIVFLLMMRIEGDKYSASYINHQY